MESLERRVLLSGTPFAGAAEIDAGIEAWVSWTDTLLPSDIDDPAADGLALLAAELPFVGQGLADGSFFDFSDLTDALTDVKAVDFTTEAAYATALTNALLLNDSGAMVSFSNGDFTLMYSDTVSTSLLDGNGDAYFIVPEFGIGFEAMGATVDFDAQLVLTLVFDIEASAFRIHTDTSSLDVVLDLHATLATATGDLGFVEVDLTGVLIDLDGTFKVDLLGDGDEFMTLMEIQNSSLQNLAVASLEAGSATLDLPSVVVTGLPTGGSPISGGVKLSWGDITDLTDISLDGADPAGLLNFANAGASDIFNGLAGISNAIQAAQGFGASSVDIPLIGQSISDLLSFGDQFAAEVDRLGQAMFGDMPGPNDPSASDSASDFVTNTNTLGDVQFALTLEELSTNQITFKLSGMKTDLFPVFTDPDGDGPMQPVITDWVDQYQFDVGGLLDVFDIEGLDGLDFDVDATIPFLLTGMASFDFTFGVNLKSKEAIAMDLGIDLDDVDGDQIANALDEDNDDDQLDDDGIVAADGTDAATSDLDDDQDSQLDFLQLGPNGEHTTSFVWRTPTLVVGGGTAEEQAEAAFRADLDAAIMVAISDAAMNGETYSDLNDVTKNDLWTEARKGVFFTGDDGQEYYVGDDVQALELTDGAVDVTDIVPLSRRFFVQEAADGTAHADEHLFKVNATLATQGDFDIAATLGFLGLDIGGSVSISPEFTISAEDPTDSMSMGWDDGRLDLYEFNEQVNDYTPPAGASEEPGIFDRFEKVFELEAGGEVVADFTATADAAGFTTPTLEIDVRGNLSALDNPFPYVYNETTEAWEAQGMPDPDVVKFLGYDALQLIDPGNVDFIYVGTNLESFNLDGLKNLSPGEIIQLVAQGAAVLGDLAGLDLMNVDVPLVGADIGELVDFTSKFADLVDGLQDGDAEDTDEFNALLNAQLQGLGMPTDPAMGTTPQVQLIVGANDLRIKFNFAPTLLGETVPFDLDLGGALNLSSTGGEMNVGAGIDLGLTFGILYDDQDGALSFAERTFLADGSQFEFTADIDASVSNIGVQVGPIEASIGGTVALGARFGVALSDSALGTKGYVTFQQLADDVVGSVDVSASGPLDASLIVQSNVLPDDFRIEVAGDLAALATNSFDFDKTVEEVAALDPFGMTPLDTVYIATDFTLPDFDLNLGLLVNGFILATDWIGGTMIEAAALDIDVPVLGDFLGSLDGIGADLVDVSNAVDAKWLELNSPASTEPDADSAFVVYLETELATVVQSFFPSGPLAPMVSVAVTELDGDPFDLAFSDSIAVSIVLDGTLLDFNQLQSLAGGFAFGDAFALDFMADVAFGLEYSLGFSFGVDVTTGFFFGEPILPTPVNSNLTTGSLFQVKAKALASDIDAQTTLFGDVIGIEVTDGFLALGGTPIMPGGMPSEFATFTIGVADDSGLLTFGEVSNPNSDLTDLMEVVIDFQVDLSLPITTTIDLPLAALGDLAGSGATGGLFPSISADLVLQYAFNDNLLERDSIAPLSGGSAGQLYFAAEGATIELGGFFDGLVKPILRLVDEYNPFGADQIKGALDVQVPVIDTTVRGLLGDLVNTLGSQSDKQLWQVFLFLVDLEGKLDAWDLAGQNAFSLDLGNFVVVDDSAANLALGANGLAGSRLTGSGGALNNSLPDWFEAIKNALSPAGLADPLLEFPILDDPLNVFGLILGAELTGTEASFIQFNAPEITVGPTVNVSETLSLSVPFLEGSVSVALGGTLGLTARLGVGFDARGFTEGHEWYDGFYLVDYYNDDGTDAKEIKFGGSITASVNGDFAVDFLGLELAAVHFSGHGGAEVSAGLDFNDEAITLAAEDQGDGKFHLDEIERVWLTHGSNPGNLLSNPTGFLCLFNFGVDMYWDLSFSGSAEVWTPFGYVEIFNETFSDSGVILNETFSCEPSVQLAERVGNDIVLLMGPQADNRLDGLGDVDEDFVVRHISGNRYEVEAFGFSLEYTLGAGGKIIADGGLGDDTITIENGNGAQVLLVGGEGNDKIEILAGAWGELRGDSFIASLGGAMPMSEGNDTLIGGALADTLYGNGGDDSLLGGDGGDSIFGGGGADYADGGMAGDTLHGGSENDTLLGDAGEDSILGQGGDDDLYGGDDKDTLIGGADSDELWGDGGNDLLRGDFEGAPSGTSGKDTLRGGDGEDTLFGGALGDELYGGGDDDTLDGEAGDDLLLGEAGSDLLLGGTDNDTLEGGSGNDTLQGEGGDDVARGGGDSDTVQGNDGMDSLFGGAGGDLVEGGDDDDFVVGGASTNGTDGADVLLGGLGNDLLIGDNASILGTFGEFTAKTLGQSDGGNDTIQGEQGNDTLLGGRADDKLYGALETGAVAGDDNDLIFGDGGEVIVAGGLTLRAFTRDEGGEGNDTLVGETGDDVLLGGLGSDVISGGSGADVALGDRGAVDYDLDGDATDIDRITDEFAEMETLTSAVGGFQGIDPVLVGGTVNGPDPLDGDTVTGGIGDDILVGGIDGDLVQGEADDDLIFGDSANIMLVDGAVTLAESADPTQGGTDQVEGGKGNDTLLGGRAGDKLYGALETGAVVGDDNDLIFGDGGTVIAAGGLTLRASTRDEGGEGNDTLVGETGEDVLLGGLGSDEISGGDGADVALGDRGAVDYDLDGDATDIDRVTDRLSEMQTLTAAGGGGFQSIDAVLVGGTVNGPGPLDGDTVTGGAGNDILVGGIDGDLVQGEVGEDLLFGDSADIMLVDGLFTLAESVDPTEGGTDQVEGGEDRDSILGGGLSDTLDGASGDDLIFGDSGRIDRTQPAETSFESIHMLTADLGGSDSITAGSGEDTVIGGQANDLIFGGADDDDLIGGHNRAGGHDGISKDGNDSIFGEGGQDVIVGDNADVVRQTGSLSSRFRVLETGELWDAMLGANVDAADHDDLSGFTRRDITIFDHNQSSDSVLYGNDTIVGGEDEDMIFGQRGNDTLRGDLDLVPAGGDSNPDGADDYIEGGGDSDLIYGDGGQDDLIGGSSELFGLTTAADRSDGADTIFGGSGFEAGRNEFSDDDHGADADVILGDNGNIYRLVGLNGVDGGAYLSFAYDNYVSGEEVIVRAFDELDYTPGQAGAPSNGDGDEIHGEGGNDTILGMTGSDSLFGDAQDDDVYGGADSDWISGGTGEDGVLGDDGRIFTSRNAVAEDLYGIEATTQFFKETRPDHRLENMFFVDGELRKTVDLEPFDEGGDDTVYGGLGDDSLHAGAGDDLVSGAEALEGFFAMPNATPDHDYVTVADPDSQDNKFADYDYTALREKIIGHALNFNASEGMESGEGDGDDAIFGDQGNDWLVGGTGRDHLYGGAGNDFLNMDDNLETDGGNNNLPDSGEYHIGDTGFGGGGVDTLTGASCDDRLVDSVGVHNLFVVPFFNIDAPVVTHGPMPPEISDFILLLGWQDGADQTLFDANDPLAAERRGEPNGELSLILPGDAEFGGEVTPIFSNLPGNIPGQDCDGHPTAGPEGGAAGDDDGDSRTAASGQGSAGGGGPLPGPGGGGGGGGNPGGGNPGGPGTGPQPGPGAPEPATTPGSEPERQGAPAPFEVRFTPDAQRGVRVTVESAPDMRPAAIETAPELEPALGTIGELSTRFEGGLVLGQAALVLGDVAGFEAGTSFEASASPIEFVEVDLDAPAPVENVQWQELEAAAGVSEPMAAQAVAVSWSETPDVALKSAPASSARVNWRGFSWLGRGGL